ncbi:MORG1 [Mytilus coruscus]|uniref:WD repeat domain-containing protein 83 n=1 Tax=Mytilus coruscus TaxID=42192 RepID=A0A6J8CW56_MYTCO|nr:MORG1 [Mytilus coruscus]
MEPIHLKVLSSSVNKDCEAMILDEATDSVTSLQVSDYEILSGSADGCIRRYDLRNGKMFVDFIGKSVSSTSFTRDGQCVLTSTMDDSIKLMDKDTGEMLNEFKGHQNHDYKIDNSLNCQDTCVVSGSEDGHVYFWDLVEAKVIYKMLHEGQKVVHSLTFHPTETCLLTAAADKIYVWRSSPASEDG